VTAPDPAPGDLPHSPRVPFAEALGFWVRLGFINFGGPTGQIALMHTELVERRGWIGEASFLHALNFAMLLPGPEAHQLAIYVGWLLNGTPGALAAGVFFLLPAFGLMLALSWIYAVHGDVTWISGVFDGLAWAVVGIVSAALLRIGARALGHAILVALAAAAFLALFLFGVIASLFGPIKYGILPDHLQRSELPAGNALVEGATFIAILLGTIVGGLAGGALFCARPPSAAPPTVNAGLPVNISYNTRPSAYTSVRAVTSRPSCCSGAM